MAKIKTDIKIEKIEREYIIPLREKGRVVPIYKKTPKAIKTIKEFLVRHMKIRDRDLDKIKIDGYLNEFMWGRGIKNPPHKIKVKAIKEGDIVTVELVDFSENLKFKKLRAEKFGQKAKEIAEGKKKDLEKAKEESEINKEEKTDEEIKEEREKTQASIEATEKMEKASAKQLKHQIGGKDKAPNIKRVALKK